MVDDPTTVSDNVVPLFSKAMLPKRITAASFARAMSALNDCLRGSLRKDGPVERLFVQIHALLWTIARQDDVDNAVLQLSIVLTELDETLARRAEAATAAAEVERTAPLERELSELRTALEAIRTAHAALETTQRETAAALETERTERAGDRTAQNVQVASLTCELDGERAARAAAERARLDEIRIALAALRAESTSGAQTFAALTDLVERASAARDATAAAIDAMGTATATDRGLNLLAARAKLGQRQRTLDGYLEQIEDLLGQVAEELGDLPDEQRRLGAVARTAGGTVAVEAVRQLTAIDARQLQLERFSDALVQLKEPAERERDHIKGLIHAVDQLTQPPPEKTALATIPDYPGMPTPEEAAAIMAAAGPLTANQPSGGDAVEPADASSPAATADPIAVRLAVVLYDIVHRNFGPEQRLILWVAKAAFTAAILQRHGLDYWAFSAQVLSRKHKALLDRYLRYKGTISGNKSVTFFVRTEEPTPTEWGSLVTNTERDAFIAAFRERIAARAAVKARAAAKE